VNGDSYDGDYQRSKKQGEGIYTYANGTKELRKYERGKL